ncbi:unnamed protein product [Adineta ricciae]|uniref:Uncharacterized protein n=1 Tax=Adineta ricciae TaxID=249248 RepID=A0A815B6G0_ADIRI|nr:unnamed protein product [Adineta ricciae]
MLCSKKPMKMALDLVTEVNMSSVFVTPNIQGIADLINVIQSTSNPTATNLSLVQPRKSRPSFIEYVPTCLPLDSIPVKRKIDNGNLDNIAGFKKLPRGKSMQLFKSARLSKFRCPNSYCRFSTKPSAHQSSVLF